MKAAVTTSNNVVRGITRDRAIFLYHLRVNPNNVEQITGVLKDSLGRMCAVGLGCDAFKIPMRDWEKTTAGVDVTGHDPYKALADKLQISAEAVKILYTLNDTCKLSFAEVARVAEKYFNSDQTRNVYSIYDDLRAKGVF